MIVAIILTTASMLHVSTELPVLMALEVLVVGVHLERLGYCAISMTRALLTRVMQTPYVRRVQLMVHSLARVLKGTKVPIAQKTSMNAFKVNF